MSGEWVKDRGTVMEKLSNCEEGISRLEKSQGRLNDAFNSFCMSTSETLGSLKAKSGIWGVIGGALTSVAIVGGAVVVWMIKG